jgi:hypothetical protein
MADRPTSILTESQREYIQGKLEHENSANERNLRSRLRDRIYTALEYDGHLLTKLDSAERKQIFRDWESLQYETVPEGLSAKTDSQKAEGNKERFLLKDGITDLITFLYLGIKEGNVGEFEEIVANAVQSARNEHGEAVKNVDVSITIEEYEQKEIEEMSLAELSQRFESGDIDSDTYFEEVATRRNEELKEEGSLSARESGYSESYKEWLEQMADKDWHEE